MSNPYTQTKDTNEPKFTQLLLPDEAYEVFNLTLPDEKLDKLLITSLEANVQFWNQRPWRLKDVDVENVKYFLGEQSNSPSFVRDDESFIDNRLFASTRAILSYATGQLAVPEITPSRGDRQYLNMARNIQSALYQHSLDEKVDQKTRAAVMNLIVRKRGFMKLRYDKEAGMFGDIVTEVVSPEDIIIDRNARFMQNPNVIYHRLRCSVDELIAKFPNKEAEILTAYEIKQGRFTQLSRFVTYFEAWFTYFDAQNISREGVCWFIPEHHLILDKMPNPNWVYSGDDQKDKRINVVDRPPKPFVGFNYLNFGGSFIDETCLFEQAKPQQEMLNKRGKQFNKNVDYMNGRWVASSAAMNEEDAQKLINKGSKTVLMVNAEDVNTAIKAVTPAAQSPQVYESMQDFRNEVDGLMGTPTVFRGANPESQDTLGRDLMLKQQAGMLQDDLVRAVNIGMENYYQLKLQLMRVYYTDDYWFQVKGPDGKFDFIMLNGDAIDSNVKIGVQVDSTLPLDKSAIRANALELAKMNRIDQLTLMEDMGMPNPEIRTERYIRSQLDPYTYMQSVEQQMDDNDADVDLMLLLDGKVPQERDDYDQSYLDFFNKFLTTNRFTMLAQQQKEAVVAFIAIVQHKAAQSANLQTTMLNQAGIINQPPLPPMPKRTENIRIIGNMGPQQTQEIAGQASGQPQPPAGPPAAPPAPPQK